MNYKEKNQIFTIGHSNRSLDEFVKILKHYNIEVLVDVRRFPRSRHNPQFSKENLESKLTEIGIEYTWIENLGGFRKGGYVDYMETEDFKSGLESLIEIARQKRTAIMCAELLWFKCHRSFIASALTKEDWQIFHIYNEKRAEIHMITNTLF